MQTINLLNLTLHAITEKQCIDHVLKELDRQSSGVVVTVNLDHLRRFYSDSDYRHYYQNATVCVADGMPLIWASRIQGTPLPERVTGSNLIWSLTAAAANANRTIFLLGGEPGTAEATAVKLIEKNPSLKIAGILCPSYGFEKNPREIEKIAQVILDAKPDLVYVALGSPKQDKLINQLQNQLSPVWWMGVGISFSFVSGQIRRAPVWVQQAGLEWVYRLLQEPQKLAKRYLFHGLPFAFKLFVIAAWRRLFQFNEEENNNL